MYQKAVDSLTLMLTLRFVNKNDSMLANASEVKDLIPQKKPFVMVGELVEYSEEHIVSTFTPSESNLFMIDNQFLEPGIIENMAQTVALYTGCQFFLLKKPAPVGYIGSINNVIITRLPKLKEVLTTKISIVQEFMGVTLVNIEVKIADELIASGRMKTVLAE